jgi:hypothetical protein
MQAMAILFFLLKFSAFLSSLYIDNFARMDLCGVSFIFLLCPYSVWIETGQEKNKKV